MKHISNTVILATLSATALFAAALSAQGNLEMGKMWTLENPPLAYLEKEYGFKPDQKWLRSLQLASIRFGGGCSSSFVSPKGLILTNHHCARGAIAAVSGDQLWDKNGFYAKSLEDEVKLPGLTVQQLASTEDVTARMNEGIENGDDDATIDSQHKANRGKILATFKAKNPGLKPEIVTLFQGAVYQLYAYKIYNDIRLVCSPHEQIAFFGGDPDNFTYPRYCIDFTFCRAYEDGKPLDTSAHYFKWSKTGAKAGELVFTTGNPGRTSRLLTKAQMDQQRDTTFPIRLDRIDVAVATLKGYRAKDPEFEKATRTMFFGAQNSQKALHGYYGGLVDKALMEQKVTAEAEFRNKVDEDERLKAKYADAWTKLADIAKEQHELQPRLALQRDYNSPILTRAMKIVAALDPESDDPEAARKAALEPLGKKQRYADDLFAEH